MCLIKKVLYNNDDDDENELHVISRPEQVVEIYAATWYWVDSHVYLGNCFWGKDSRLYIVHVILLVPNGQNNTELAS